MIDVFGNASVFSNQEINHDLLDKDPEFGYDLWQQVPLEES
jgi:hypothetical protein